MPITVITREDRAASAADHWAEQYANYKGSDSAAKMAVGRALRELGARPDPDDVDRIIGNRSWTRLACNNCQREAAKVVQVGEAPSEYESYTASLCLDCVQAAAKAMRGNNLPDAV